MDFTSILGLILGIGGILVGQVIEGGHVGSLIQGAAALIVFGGTLGAVLVGAPMKDVKVALELVKYTLLNYKGTSEETIMKEILAAAQVARKESVLAIERQLSGFSNDFMKTVFRFVIDGTDAKTLQDIFEEQIHLEEQRLNAGAKLFTDAGGFAPTIGIIGAVLGLIHVMSNLSDSSKLGSGIAVAFVATVYGVGSANLLFLPFGNKLKRKIKMQAEIKEMILTGALGIVGGLNPYIIEQKLQSFLEHKKTKEGAA